MRIVSLVPSLTETICDLGLRPELVACTKFCVEPSDLHRSVEMVGGTKDFDVEAILALKPSHVLCNQEENPKAPVEELMKHLPVLVTFPKGPEDVPAMLRSMGRFLGKETKFEPPARELEAALQKFIPLPPQRFLYFIWQNPYMVAGRDTYISRFLESWGWTNACTAYRYPEISLDGMREARVDRLLFSSEPYPFRKRDAERLRAEWPTCPSISKIDGQMLSWFGTRTIKAFDELEKIRREELPPL